MASFSVGLDLGQGNDFSALVVVERVLVLPVGVSLEQWHRQPAVWQQQIVQEHHVRHLQRWELGTPYPTVVDDVVAFMGTPAMRDGLLAFDHTGVGRAVGDMFYGVPLGCTPPIPVVTTGGREARGFNIPKRDLIAAVQAPLQQGRLRVAAGLSLGPILERELTSFRQTITPSGRESFDVQRRTGEGHGDLVSALMLALVVPNTLRRCAVIENPVTG